MVTVRVIAACPVSRDAVLTLRMQMHMLRPRKRFITVHRSHERRRPCRNRVRAPFAGARNAARVPAAATLLWMLPLVRQRLA